MGDILPTSHPAHKVDAGAPWWLPWMAEASCQAVASGLDLERGGRLHLSPKANVADGDGQAWAPQIPEPKHPVLKPQDSPLLLWSDSALCVCLSVC